jgi:hypothetical protein
MYFRLWVGSSTFQTLRETVTDAKRLALAVRKSKMSGRQRPNMDMRDLRKVTAT